MSSDEDCNVYSNFKKYRKVKRSVVEKDDTVKKIVTKKVSRKRTQSSDHDSSEEDISTAYKRHIAEKQERERKAAKKPRKEENIWAEYDAEHGTVNGERVKKPEEPQVSYTPSPSVQIILEQMQRDEMQEQLERALFQAKLAESRREQERMMEEALKNAPKYVFIKMTVMNQPNFNWFDKLDYDKQLAELLLKYAPQAGYNPNDVHLVWEKPDDMVICKFWDTPKSLNMEPYKYAQLIISGKNGVVPEIRKNGDIKLKINLASQRKPLEKIIFKDTTFGDLKKQLEKELNAPPSKMKIVFDAEVVNDSSTPATLDMEEADVIDLTILD